MADTRLKLEGVSERVQQTFGVAEAEEAVFIRREIGPHHDAVRFANGAEVSIQQLGPGVKVQVIDALDRPLRIDTRERELA
jgi:hypothetical protein